MIQWFMPKKKSSPSKKAGILACKHVVARSDIRRKGKTVVRKGSAGDINFQRKTPNGYGRSTVDFDGKEIEVENSKLKCV